MVVEPVGSCCTLVAEQVMARNPALLDPVTASLLYGEYVASLLFGGVKDPVSATVMFEENRYMIAPLCIVRVYCVLPSYSVTLF